MCGNPTAKVMTEARRRVRTRSLASVILSLASAGLLLGLVGHASGADTFAEASWGWTGAAGLVLSVWWVAQTARKRKLGVDAVAVLALAGALSVGEYLAAALITVMLATGRSLERWAAGRAERDLHALLRRSPTVVHRHQAGALVDTLVGDVGPGDVLLVRPGDVVAVDGTVRSDFALVDESALTGEPLPVTRRRTNRSAAVS